MKVRLPSAALVAAVVGASLLLLVVPAGFAAASTPSLTPGPAYTLWAYGVLKNVSFSGRAADGAAFQGDAQYGYSVILNQMNLSSSQFELNAQRTMGATLSVEYCYPTCKSPTESGTIYHRAWESVNSSANFTTDGVVLSNGQNVSAIALLNSHTTVAGSLFETAQGPLRSSLLSANISASAEVDFSTPLGLLPNNLTGPMSWTSNSAFTASGGWALHFYYKFVGPKLQETIGPVDLSGVVNGSGAVSVNGSAQAGSVNLGGSPYTNVSLTTTGPFAFREGFILVPDQINLFGTSSSGAVGSNESASTSVEMTSLYVNTHTKGHLGVGGSEWVYTSSTLDPSSTAAVAGAGSEGPALASGANPVASTPVQGVPISVAQAQGNNNCLVTGTSCPPATSSPRSLLGTAVVLGAVVVALLIAVVLVTERRRIPPPTYPNSKLYPPGGPSVAPARDTARSGAERRAPPTADDDPLSNLW
jgi:hypothetical protein